jgi:stage V sporulation protein G
VFQKELREKSSFSSERYVEAHALHLGQRWVNRRIRVRQALLLLCFLVGLALAAAAVSAGLLMINFDSLPHCPSDPSNGKRNVKVTYVKVFLKRHPTARAYVNIVLDDSLMIRGLRIIHESRGYFVARPSKTVRGGRKCDIAHPITAEARQIIEEALTQKYELHG